MIRTLIPFAALAVIIRLAVMPGWQHAAHGTQVAQVGGIIAIALVIRLALSVAGGGR